MTRESARVTRESRRLGGGEAQRRAGGEAKAELAKLLFVYYSTKLSSFFHRINIARREREREDYYIIASIV